MGEGVCVSVGQQAGEMEGGEEEAAGDPDGLRG